MSPNPENINVPFTAQIVVPDHLAVDVVDFKASMVCLDSLLDFGRAGDEDVLAICQ